nr:hypothetical protein BaRGS_024181 [Batillaria attramentaria]
MRHAWFEACRAFGILSILALAACLACVVLMCLMSEQKIFGLLAPVSAAVGAFCCLITFAVYAGESGQSDFGYSFALVIVAFLLAGVAAVLLFLGKSRSSG